MNLTEFAKVWGVVSENSIRVWLRIYKSKGPQGLESVDFKDSPKKRGPAGIHQLSVVLPAFRRDIYRHTNRRIPNKYIVLIIQILGIT